MGQAPEALVGLEVTHFPLSPRSQISAISIRHLRVFG